MADQIVVFTLDSLTYALPLNSVVKVIHAIEIRPLPEAPEIIAGIINIKGQIIPVADIRRRLKLETRDINADDRFIITDTGTREIALIVDTVAGIRDLAPEHLESLADTNIYPRNIKGILKTADGIILIYDLSQFLSLDEEAKLEKAIKVNLNVS